MIDFSKLEKQMGDLEDDAVLETLKQLMAEAPADAGKAMEACRAGLENVGKRFEEGEYYLSDLIFAGDLMADAAKIIKPALAQTGGGNLGKMIIATVKGDLHDIGKNIVISVFDAAGFEVIDLGIDVDPELIVKTAKENDVKIIGLSGVLSLAVESMKTTVDAFKKAGMRDKVKIILGGCPVTEIVKEYAGADAWTLNPQLAVGICRKWV
jgi:methylmalonyl-CoA mutase cobalamin-binding domain/chain